MRRKSLTPQKNRDLLLAGVSALALLLTQTSTASATYTIDNGTTETVPGSHPALWDLGSDRLTVGANSTGTLHITAGGVVSTGVTVIGSSANSSGIITVDGAGARLIGTGADAVHASYVGQYGSGELSITQGGAAEFYDLTVASATGSAGTITIDGSGATIVTTAALKIGVNGRGTLRAVNGGAVTANILDIANSTTGGATNNGAVMISGRGSTVTAQTGSIGNAGEGSITISSGGALNVGTLTLAGGSANGSKGSLNIGAAPGQAAAAGGTFSGNVVFGPGDGVINFNQTDSLTIDASISSAAQSPSGGTINQIAGDVTLTGDNSKFGGTVLITGGVLELGRNGTSGDLGTASISTGNDATHHGELVFRRSDRFTANNVITGTGSVGQYGTGTTVLTQSNSYSGGTELIQGAVSVSADDNLGEAAGTLKFDGATLQITGTSMTSTQRSIIWQSGGGGFDIADANNVFTISQGIGTAAAPGGKLAKTGAGTLVLSGYNHYSGGTDIDAGTLSVSSDSNLGNVNGDLRLAGGTLQATSNLTTGRAVRLSGAGGGFAATSGTTLTLANSVSDLGAAPGALTKTGAGTLILAAANSYSGGTLISEGTLRLGSGAVGHDGLISGDIVDNASLAVANLGSTRLDGVISGTGSLTQEGPGTLTLSGNNSYSGGTALLAGTISVSQDANLGAPGGALSLDGGTLQVSGTDFEETQRSIQLGGNGGGFDIADAGNSFRLDSALSGTGTFNKSGAGALVLSADSSLYSGAVDVRAGDLRLDGAILGGSLSVGDQADLGGHGTISGAASFASGATLFGQSNQQITFGNGLTLASGSQTDVTLNGGPSTQALFDVNGDLALNGTLNVEQGSVVGAGVYRIFNYSGALTQHNMTIGTVADGTLADYSLQTAIDHQVNLINYAGRNFFFWDGTGTSGDGTIHGGDGTWNAANTNWTSADGLAASQWQDDTFAVFGGAAGTGGTITLDAGFTPSVNGMQFMNDGYLLSGGSLTLAGYGDQLILVGDGSLQSAAMTATIASVIEGSEGLRKSGAGQLVLTGENSYTGTTTVTEGLLTLGEGGSIDPSSDIVLASTRYGSGNLAIDKTTDFTLSNQISGTGDVFKRGSGTTTFAGDNSFSGGLNVEAGTAKAGVADHAFGSGRVKIAGGATLDLADLDETIGGLDGNQSGDGNITLGSGTLTLNQDLHGGYSGVISGSGGLVKNGSGDLVLFGANSYSGHSTINAGSLVQGAQGGFSSASTYSVASGATMELGGFATGMAALNNAGSVAFGGQGGTVLSVSGDYVGNGGTLLMSTVLGDDSAQTDQLVVTGNTAGDTKLSISNRGGLGAQTVNGIKIIDVGGQSDGRFTLNGDYTTKDGQQAIMTASAYAYTLQKGSGQNGGPGQGSVQASGSANTDGNWYLVSQNTKAPDPSDPVDPTCEETNSCPPPQPGPPRYSAAAPIYQSYLANLKALNQLPTLTQRVGDRYLDGAIQATTAANAAAGETTPSGIWGRIEGAHNRIQSTATAGDLSQNINSVILQAGLDGQFYENDKGRVIAGLTGQYGNAHSNIDNRTGDGSGTIDTQAWGLGATATFYGNNGFYLDAQAQANWYDSDLDVDAVNRGLARGNKGFGYALSLEAGQHVTLDENWSLTPQAQLMWSTVDFDSFTDSYGARISSHEGDNLNARVGLAANYQNSFTGADGRKVDTAVYGIANLYQTLIGNNRINYAGTRMASDDDRSWAGIGLGGSYGWADNKYALYGEGSVNTSLDHFADSYSLKGNLGFKVNW
ncbi:autotransporter outer membrane beta-barrel domain-containing protein [Brucella pituitosa]|uniref:autotransporter outer membrane beta-barrel domain-containing protein n=1 Tax=Brucella pituitosa TaxID=571256 RepID=UPI0009A19631|nr:autotransporter outer membrane beta-barrel domain-containing protein [Brucella pituitosa]